MNCEFSKLKMKSPDAVDGNVTKIAALFPHCVTESKSGGVNGTPCLKIDWDKLKDELSKDIIESGQVN